MLPLSLPPLLLRLLLLCMCIFFFSAICTVWQKNTHTNTFRHSSKQFAPRYIVNWRHTVKSFFPPCVLSWISVKGFISRIKITNGIPRRATLLLCYAHYITTTATQFDTVWPIWCHPVYSLLILISTKSIYDINSTCPSSSLSSTKYCISAPRQDAINHLFFFWLDFLPEEELWICRSQCAWGLAYNRTNKSVWIFICVWADWALASLRKFGTRNINVCIVSLNSENIYCVCTV